MVMKKGSSGNIISLLASTRKLAMPIIFVLRLRLEKGNFTIRLTQSHFSLNIYHKEITCEKMKRLILLLVLIFVFGCIEQKTGADEGKGKWVATETGMFLTPNATAIVIEAPDCFACDYADYILLVSEREDLGTRITNITRLSHNSTQAKLLISRYKIGKVPVLILKKDTEWDHRMLSWWNSAIGTYETERTLVMREVYPPYYDLETGEFRRIQGIC